MSQSPVLYHREGAGLSSTVSSSRLPRLILCSIVFFFAASASFNGYYSECRFREVGTTWGSDQCGLQQVLDGTAYRPFIYRQLMPSFANWAERVTPASTQAWLYSWQKNPDDPLISALLQSPLAMSQQYFFRYLVYYETTFIFALIATFAMYLVCLEMGTSFPVAVAAPVVMILLLPYIMGMYGDIYDYPELAFLALAVFITARYNWMWAIPIAILGAWNKESFLFIVLTLYPFIRRKNSRMASIAGVAVLSLICTAIYMYLRHQFAQNPGATAYLQYREQLHFIAHPRLWLFTTQPAYGLRVPQLMSFFPGSLLIWAVWRAWKGIPVAVRQHAKIAAVINVPLFLLFCGPAEARDLSMLYIALLMVIAANLESLFRQGDGVPHDAAGRELAKAGS